MKKSTLKNCNKLACAVIFALSLHAQDAWANGAPYAPSATGGIEYKYNDKISIESEVLRVSPYKISVSYIFKSSAQTPQTVDIAFPIAVDDANYREAKGTRPEGNVEPHLKVSVNGQSITSLPRVFLDRVEVTDWLYVFPDREQPSDILKSDRDFRPFFKQHNLRYICDKEDEKPSADNSCFISGDINVDYRWRQTFEPGETRVDVSYVPDVGGDYYFGEEGYGIDRDLGHGFGVLTTDERNPDPTFREFFCIDDNTAKAIERKAANQDAFSGHSVMYIWDTARYWQGPIKKFHLIIEKDFPEQIISYCPYIGSKTSPTTFEWQTENFVPQGRFKVLFLPSYKPEN